MPRVSINLCCYNSARYVSETLESILAQRYRDWELIIIDDGSTDATERLIERYRQAHPQIRFARQDHAGLAHARNHALRLSSGEFIAFIDHDDVWEPEKLERQVPMFDRNPLVGLVYSDCLTVPHQGRPFREFQRFRPSAGQAFKRLLSQYGLILSTVVIRRSALEGLREWFDPRFEVLEDADLFLRIARDWEVAFCRAPLARWRRHPESATRTRRDRIPIEMRLLLRKQRDLKPGFEQTFRREIARYELEIIRLEARTAWEKNQRQLALEALRPHWYRQVRAAKDFWLMKWFSYQAYEWVRARVVGSTSAATR